MILETNYILFFTIVTLISIFILFTVGYFIRKIFMAYKRLEKIDEEKRKK